VAYAEPPRAFPKVDLVGGGERQGPSHAQSTGESPSPSHARESTEPQSQEGSEPAKETICFKVKFIKGYRVWLGKGLLLGSLRQIARGRES
jgi:hypothetical protein